MIVIHIRMPYDGDACKNAMMVMHVGMQCDAIHIDVMRKITCKVKQHTGLKGRSDMVSTSTHNSPNKVGSNVFILNASWSLRSPFLEILSPRDRTMWG